MSIDGSADIYFGSRILGLQAPYLCGRDVAILQALLGIFSASILSVSMVEDGIFGPDTRIAVKQFQKYFKLKADGVVRWETFYALGHRTGRYCKNQPVFSSRALKAGMQGGDVQVLQNRLAAYRKTLINRPANGKYTSMTENAVKAFQLDFSAEDNDHVNPDTYENLFIHAPLGGRVLKRGRKGMDTYWLQLLLHDMDCFDKFPHGFFDRYTERMVRKFQSEAGIRVDGIAGPQTFLAIGNSLPLPRHDYAYPAHRGEHLQDIAHLLGTDTAILAQLNSLKPSGYRVKTSKFLNVPLPRAFHLVQKGDTLTGIAARYGIDQAALMRANRPFSSSELLQGDTVFLPGYGINLKGYIVYSHDTGGEFVLKSLNLETMKADILHVFQRHSHPYLAIGRTPDHVRVFNRHRQQTASYILTHRKSGPPVLTPLRGGTSRPKYSIQSLTAQLKKGSHSNSKAKTILSELLLEQDDSSLSLRIAPDGNSLLLFSPDPPGRESATYLVDMNQGSLTKIHENDIEASFSPDSKLLLMLSREYFGSYYPWFNRRLQLYSSRGILRQSEIYSRGLEIHPDCFSRDSAFFTLVIHNPNTFYPLPVTQRNVYIKKTAAPLIIQLTSGEMASQPVWL